MRFSYSFRYCNHTGYPAMRLLSGTESSCDLSWQLWATGLSTAFQTPRTAFDILKSVSFKLFLPKQGCKWDHSSHSEGCSLIQTQVKALSGVCFQELPLNCILDWQGRSDPWPQTTYCFQHFLAEGKGAVLFPSDTLSLGKVRTCWDFCLGVILKQVNPTKAKVAGPASA